MPSFGEVGEREAEALIPPFSQAFFDAAAAAASCFWVLQEVRRLWDCRRKKEAALWEPIASRSFSFPI